MRLFGLEVNDAPRIVKEVMADDPMQPEKYFAMMSDPEAQRYLTKKLKERMGTEEGGE